MLIFFFIDTAPTEIYTLSLHDALPIFNTPCRPWRPERPRRPTRPASFGPVCSVVAGPNERSEEHTSELQSRGHLVCRLLLEKKKKRITENQSISQAVNGTFPTQN